MSGPVGRYAALALFLLVSVGGGFAVGIANPPGAWYAGLAKPWFTPPDALFPLAWTVLYVLAGFAGWRVFTAGLGRATVLWFVQMAVNVAWSPVFFGAHRLGWGLAVLVLLLAAILLFVAETWNRDRAAALCFGPYGAWVAFAALLNGAIWLSNDSP